MSLLGIDVGTSGVRAVAFSLAGEELASHERRYELRRPAPGRVELDAGEMIAATEAAVAAAASEAASKGNPARALAFSVLGEAVVPIDAEGEPLAPVAVSMDTRGSEAAARLGQRIGAEAFTRVTGQPLHGMFSVFKIAAGDEAWQAAAGYRCIGDLLTERWTGSAVIDFSQAARLGVFDIEAGAWSSELVVEVAVDAPWLTLEKLPAVTPGASIAGRLRAAAARRLGLEEGLPVVAGAHDQAAAFIGAGGVPDVRSVISFGSSDCVTTGSDRRPHGIDVTGFATYRVDDSLWVTLAGTAAGGWALEWFAGIVGGIVADVFADLAAEPPRLLALPYLAGSGTLDNDPDARGVIHGLTLETTTPELARALVEASGYEFAKVFAALRTAGIDPGAVSVTGSGSRNPAALAARAAAAGLPLTPANRDAAARGAAILAARGIGFPTEGLERSALGDRADAQHPEAGTSDWYERQRAAYVDLYDSTLGVAHHLSATPTQTTHEQENTR